MSEIFHRSAYNHEEMSKKVMGGSLVEMKPPLDVNVRGRLCTIQPTEENGFKESFDVLIIKTPYQFFKSNTDFWITHLDDELENCICYPLKWVVDFNVINCEVGVVPFPIEGHMINNDLCIGVLISDRFLFDNLLDYNAIMSLKLTYKTKKNEDGKVIYIVKRAANYDKAVGKKSDEKVL